MVVVLVKLFRFGTVDDDDEWLKNEGFENCISSSLLVDYCPTLHAYAHQPRQKQNNA